MPRGENQFVGAVNEYLAEVLAPSYAAVRRAEATLRAVLAELKLRADRGAGAADRVRTWLVEAIAATSAAVPDELDSDGAGRKLLSKLDAESAEEASC
jgi:hypothetical protein